MRHGFSLFLAFFLIFQSITVFGANNEADGSFTLLIYMNGSNLESKYGLATADLEEMLSVDITGRRINVVILAGGTKQWSTAGITDLSYAKITEDGFSVTHKLQPASIGVPSTLTDFIIYGVNEFPAERYGLILWNHGGGSVIGYGYDEQFNGDSLTLKELSQGLSRAGQKFSFIGFDACLMAGVEVANVCAPYADYMVASEELEPGGGWDYAELFRTLTSPEKMSAKAICCSIADGFEAASWRENSNEQITISVTDLSAVPDVTKAVGLLGIDVAKSLLEGKYAEVSKQRGDAKYFGRPSKFYQSYDMVDAYDLAAKLKTMFPKSCKELQAAVKKAVVYNRSRNISNAYGLSLYFPLANKKIAADLSEYMESGFVKTYLDMTSQYAEELLKGDAKIPIIDIGEIYGQSSITLTPKLLAQLSHVYSMIVRKNGEVAYCYGLDSDVLFDNNTYSIVSEFTGECIGINGVPVAAYTIEHTSRILTYAVPCELNGKRAELIVCYDDINPYGAVQGARYITDYQQPDKGCLAIKPGDKVQFLYQTVDVKDCKLTEVWHKGESITVGRGLEVGLVDLPHGDYLQGFYMVDVYQNEHYSHFIEHNITD